jgi:hypothetical protein
MFARSSVVIRGLALGLVFIGFCTAIASLLVLLIDAAAWAITGHWQSTSFVSLFGALPVQPFSNWKALLIGLSVQPVWVLMMGVGALTALFGSLLLPDDADD